MRGRRREEERVGVGIEREMVGEEWINKEEEEVRE
jgi:hypothetical protein